MKKENNWIMKKENENNCLDFHYPVHKGEWMWEWPWNIYGGFLNWFYHKWSVITPNGSKRWDGLIILGFKRINITWLLEPEEAVLEYYEGHKRLFNHLMRVISTPAEFENEYNK